MMTKTLQDRVDRLKKIEDGLTKTASQFLIDDQQVLVTSLFLLSALQRTIEQSRGFRSLILDHNFGSAAILLRAQIDTAMRINGLNLIEHPESSLKQILSGEKQFNQLFAQKSFPNAKPQKLTDVFLRESLGRQHAFIDRVYKETSNFVHLSFRNLFISSIAIDDHERMIHFAFSADAIPKEEDNYFEIYDAFIRVTEIAHQLVIAHLESLV